jgi:hypothetical protein
MDLNSPLIAIPLFASIVVLIVASPVVFKITDAYIGNFIKLRFASKDGLPTRVGLIVHAAVAFLAVHAYLKAYSPEITSF